MKWHRRGVLVAFLVLTSSAVGEEGAGELPTDVHPWDVYELEMTAERELSGPYVEGLPEGGPGYVSVTFQGERGEEEGRHFKMTGFWDGGRTWRVRFAPPTPGEWSYESNSIDPGLDGQTGRFRCTEWTDAERRANPTRRGFIRVCTGGPRSGRYFEYADGTPMLWLGDTWWNWTKRGIPFQRFQQLVDEQVKQSGDVRGGDIREFHPPEDYPGVEQYKDWVLYVVRR